MYLCVCLAVSETDVQAAIEGGAMTREAVTRACGAGGDCGACRGMIETMIEDHVEDVGLRCCPPSADSSERLIPQTALSGARATRAAQGSSAAPPASVQTAAAAEMSSAS